MIRYMKERYGIIFVDRTQVILRVYETDNKEWKLLQYQERELTIEKNDIADVITELLSLPYSQHIAEWKACSRNLSETLLSNITLATGLQVERLSKLREQELICKGVFTELW